MTPPTPKPFSLDFKVMIDKIWFHEIKPYLQELFSCGGAYHPNDVRPEFEQAMRSTAQAIFEEAEKKSFKETIPGYVSVGWVVGLDTLKSICGQAKE